MNRNYFKTMTIATLTSLSILLSGCGAHEQAKNNSIISTNNNPASEQRVESPDSTKKPESSTTQSSSESPESQKVESETTVSQEKEFTFFKDAKQEISNYLDSEEFETLKEKGKYYVTTGIDFIFCNQPINGVYFNDLKEDAKKTIINDVKKIDEAIMAYYPNYKESIGVKYQVAAEFLSDRYYDVLDIIRDYLGDENYEAIGDIKDQILGDLSEKKDEAVGYIKDKYNDWKNSK